MALARHSCSTVDHVIVKNILALSGDSVHRTPYLSCGRKGCAVAFYGYQSDAPSCRNSAAPIIMCSFNPYILYVVTTQALKQIMTARVDKAVSMGCDGIEPDNMDVR